MKKRILIFCSVILAFSFTAYGFANWNKLTSEEVACTKPTTTFKADFTSSFENMSVPDLVYKVDSRFIWTISKEDLQNATNLKDILPQDATKEITSFSSSKVALLNNDRTETIELGNEGKLNEAQLNLIKKIDYSDNFYVHGDFEGVSHISGKKAYQHVVYYITVIPEYEATVEEGQDKLINYLKESTKEAVTIIRKNKLEPGRVNFTIATDGSIQNVALESSCGYSSIDTNLVDLISKMPYNWRPAINSKGVAVEQEFVFFFGLDGC